jgi:predicted ATP-dependent protease
VPAKLLAAQDVGLPRFEPSGDASGEIFALSSHKRAREALEFGLSVSEPGFNIFVLGEDRSGRMTVTLSFLRAMAAGRPVPDDWLYLANFQAAHEPEPYALPAGIGRRFRTRMKDLVAQIAETLGRAFTSAGFQGAVQAQRERLAAEFRTAIEALKRDANAHGLDLMESQQGGIVIGPLAGNGAAGTQEASKDKEAPPAGAGHSSLQPAPAAAEPAAPPGPAPAGEDAALQEARARLGAELIEINRAAAQRQGEFIAWVRRVEREVADRNTRHLIEAVIREFTAHPGLVAWLGAMREDMLEGLGRFRADAADSGEPAAQRYAVNLLVDHADDTEPPVVLEANPTYENLFGFIEYQPSQGVLSTHLGLIRPGALHRANGGILVLRADALGKDRMVWDHLKAALRDGEIRVEELHRERAVPIAGAPKPQPIPLRLKVVLVGSPNWYYGVFAEDPDFYSHFKIKAEIDPDMAATQANIDCYGALIQRMANAHDGAVCEPGALIRLLGAASRWSRYRDKLSARFELVEDLLSEAHARSGAPGPGRIISEQAVVQAVGQRRRRNARAEDRLQESIARRSLLIETCGTAVGQINALTVHNAGDHEFGGPARITARTSIGRHGIVNIEREAALGGRIQHKGVLEIAGFLAGHFAQRFPLSFNCSLTFEQNYGGVEGDSASMAELLVILSDLSGLPLRQDIAITGSINQRGEAQAIGGVHYKVEGFFRTCLRGGPLDRHGVVLPAANEMNLVLHDAVTDAVATGLFQLWSVTHVDEAVAIFTGVPAGTVDAEGNYPPDSVYGRVMARLAGFDLALAARERAILADPA